MAVSSLSAKSHFERRGEIDALNRKLSRQERAILAVRAKTISNGPTAKADVHAAL